MKSTLIFSNLFIIFDKKQYSSTKHTFSYGLTVKFSDAKIIFFYQKKGLKR